MAMKTLDTLPLKKLIGEPLHAAAQAHLELSKANLEAIKGYVAQPNTDLQFNYKDKDSSGNEVDKHINMSVPVMALADLPSFSIDTLVNEFTFEVSCIQDESSEKEGSLKGSASSGGFFSKFVDFNLEGGYTKKQRNQVTNTEKGKLNITVTANRTGPTQAMTMIMEAATKAIKVTES